MSIKDSNFNLQLSMSINKSCDSSDYFGFTDLVRRKLSEDELNLKLKQVREVTNCNEEFGIITLHDCNYNVEYAINKILTHEITNEGEWKTKKGKQKKILSKEKDSDKSQETSKEKLPITNDLNLEKDLENCDKKSAHQAKKDLNAFGKTFKNYNLSKKSNNNYIIHDQHPKINTKPEINFLINGKWNERSIIIENSNYTPMPLKVIMMLKTNKNTTSESNSSINVCDKKDQDDDSSIVFKTHCTTKPPPKVSCSLVAPVQIINKTIKPHSLPKFKFGDTNFIEDLKQSELSFNSVSSNKLIHHESKFADIEDNSIIKVGPPQKMSNNQPNSSYSPDLFSPNHQYFMQNNYPIKTHSNLSNNVKSAELNIKLSDVAEYSYPNVHQHPPPTNLANCNINLSSMKSFNSTMTPKEIGSNVKSQDLFLNHSPSLGYSPQTNHVKSTIYLVQNMMMNPISGLYMTVNSPVPTSALSPPMAPLSSPFNIPQQPPVYYDESLQNDDLANKQMLAIRQLNQNRQFPRFKKTGGDISEDIAMKSDYSKPNIKNMTNIAPNHNSNISKHIPFNYPVYISPPSVASHNHSQMFINNSINSNSLNHYPNNFQAQESNTNDNVRKRNIQMQNGNGKWS